MNWPVAVSSFGRVEAGTLLWAHRGELRVTLALRTAYALTPGPITPVSPGAVERADAHYQSDPARALRTASDLAPRIPRAEVVHAGAVVAPAGITMVRLALLREGRTLFDKRAMASAKNDGTGLGPVGPGSPERSSVLAGRPEPRTNERGVLAVADDLDFGFYQAAPADQRVDVLLGGDQVLVANLHPDVPELTVLVPSRAPAARAMLGGQTAPLLLSCKRVTIDTDRRIYTLLWTGELELEGPGSVPYLRIEARAPEDAAAPVESLEGAPVAPGRAPPVILSAPVDARQLLDRIAGRSDVPAQRAASASSGFRPPQAPAGPLRATPAGTILMNEPEPVAAPAGPTGTLGTMMMTEDAPAPAPNRTLPFAAGDAARSVRPASASATPWGGELVRAAPRPVDHIAGTMAIDDEPAPPRGAPPAPPPPAPPPPAPPAAEPLEPEKPALPVQRPAIKADPWAAQEPAAPAAPIPPPKPLAPPKPNISGALYKRSKKP